DGCCGAVHRAATHIRTLQASIAEEDEKPQLRDVLRSRFQFDLTLLHFAVKVVANVDPAGQACLALLTAKADPRIKAFEGETPLHWAATDGCREIYDELAAAARRLEAEEAVRGRLVSGQGGSTEEPPSTVEPLLAETQKILRRRLVRLEVERDESQRKGDEDSSMWLQAGMLAFKHAVLQPKLRREGGESHPPSPKKSAAKSRASATGPTSARRASAVGVSSPGTRRVSGSGLARQTSPGGLSPPVRRSSVVSGSPASPGGSSGSPRTSPPKLQRTRRASLA
ncbi:unnamed protein product, partial [Symbiodinium necroappetens]